MAVGAEIRPSAELFDEALRARAVLRLDEERDLRHALEHGELQVYYQPAFLIASGKLIGLEALVRWAHPIRGLLAPDAFIPVAEETGLIGRIGEWVLQTAIDQAVRWREGHPEWPRFSMGVNVSARELGDAGFAARAAETIEAASIDPSLVVLEITETAVLNETNTSQTLAKLRRFGVHFALDDFGTGYSSLVHPKRFPIGTVKLDQSFVHGLTESREDDAIVASLTSLAHDLGVFVIAEGVETPEQARQLIAVGCQMGQGHYWAPASPAADVGANLAAVQPTQGP